MNRIFRLGTRGSALALTQSNWVADRLRAKHPGVAIEVVVIKTSGDLDRTSPLPSMGGRGVFVKEVEEALLANQVDFAVHSLKDLPSEMPETLQISAVPLREDVRDCLITHENLTLAELPAGSLVGTGSPRRRAQLVLARPDLRFADLRGNVDTRLHKLAEGAYDAIVLAMAGLSRLGKKVGQPISPDICLPAVGQGALAVQTRTTDAETVALVSVLNDYATLQAVTAERVVLQELDGGCHTPIAAMGTVYGDSLRLTGLVADSAGTVLIKTTRIGSAAAPVELGSRVAQSLLGAGAAELG